MVGDVEVLVATLRSAPTARLRKRARSLLRRLGAVEEMLEVLAGDGNDQLRCDAVHVLGAIGDRRAEVALRAVSGCSTECARVRRAARRALGAWSASFADQVVDLWPDGSAKPNPGPGGWAVVIRSEGMERELAGRAAHTTNNRMEVLGAIHGLEEVREACQVRVWTDSRYLMRGVTEWLAGWKRHGWQTLDGKPVKNRDLWERLDTLVRGKDVEWNWIRGHNGHQYNERADQLSRNERKQAAKERYAV